MPIQSCSLDNKPGFKWGQQGKCYTYDPKSETSKSNAHDKARAQGAAIGDYKMNKQIDIHMKKLKCAEILLTDDSEVDIISIVDEPAIEVNFMKFANQPKLLTLSQDKMILTGPAMIPDKLIYRVDKETQEEYNVFFSSETIQKISEQYLSKFKQANVNIDHATMVDDICLSESWIIEDPKNDKATALGYDLPKGTWMVSMKVNNQDVWNKIKAGELHGFSIEGSLVTQFAITHNRKVIDTALAEAELLLEKIKELLKNL